MTISEIIGKLQLILPRSLKVQDENMVAGSFVTNKIQVTGGPRLKSTAVLPRRKTVLVVKKSLPMKSSTKRQR